MQARRAFTATVLAMVTALALVAPPALPAAAAEGVVVSVRDYGARGDGVTDDTRAFQSAVAAAANGTLDIPAGTYLLGKVTISTPMTVTGAGTQATLLKMKAGNNSSLITVANTHHVTFTGFALDGNLTAQTGGYPHGIQFDNSPDGLVYGIRAINCEKSGVVAYNGSDRMVVKDSSFANNENDVEIHRSAYCIATNNDCVGTETEALASYEDAGGPGATHHNQFIGNRITNAWCGINFQRSYSNVASGNVITNGLRGLMMHNENSAVALDNDNVFSRNTITGSKSEAVLMSEEVSGLRFENNTITNNAGAGIMALGNVKKSAFTGNTIRDNAGQAFYAVSASAWTDSVIQRNVLTGGVKLNAGSRVAALGNTISGSTAWPTAALGALVDIGSPASAGATQWKCTTAGTPGVWTGVAPAPAPVVPGTPATTETVTRVAGASRYDTAVEISKANFTSADTVVIATGLDYADALAAAPLAGALKAPVLLVPRISVPKAVADEIARLKARKAIVVGGTSAVTADAVRALQSRGLTVERIAGSSRYATAAAIAKRTLALTGATTADTVFITRGDAYADALGISAVAYSQRFPVLLVKTDSLPAETAAALRDLKPAHVVVVGGTSAVSLTVERAVDAVVAGDITRLAGGDRYGTSAAVAAYAVTQGWADPAYIGVAAGNGFADALGGGAAAGGRGGVLLLTASAALPDPTRAFLTEHAGSVEDLVVYGSTSAVGLGVEDAMRAVCAR